MNTVSGNLLKRRPARQLPLPSGGPRQFMTPFGLQIIDEPDRQRIFVMSGGGNRNWRLDPPRRPRPAGRRPYAHLLRRFSRALGRRHAGDPSAGAFNERFWMSNGGLPHTEALKGFTGTHFAARFLHPPLRSDDRRSQYLFALPGPVPGRCTGFLNEEIGRVLLRRKQQRQRVCRCEIIRAGIQPENTAMKQRISGPLVVGADVADRPGRHVGSPLICGLSTTRSWKPVKLKGTVTKVDWTESPRLTSTSTWKRRTGR